MDDNLRRKLFVADLNDDLGVVRLRSFRRDREPEAGSAPREAGWSSYAGSHFCENELLCPINLPDDRFSLFGASFVLRAHRFGTRLEIEPVLDIFGENSFERKRKKRHHQEYKNEQDDPAVSNRAPTSLL